MKLRISSEALKLLLEEKKEYIGNRGALVGSGSTLLTFVVAITTADFHDVWVVPAQIIKIVFLLGTIINAIYFICLLYKYCNDNYTHLSLYKDIEQLSETVNEYRALVVMKDLFSAYPNRFLVYKDKIWDCFLCLHYPYAKGKENLIEHDVIQRLSQELQIPIENINATKVAEKEGEKFSYRVDEIKRYYFYYVWVTLLDSSYNSIKSDHFKIQNKEYYWKSIEELRADKKTFERNRDVIDYIEAHRWPQ